MFALTDKNILVDDLLAATADPTAGATVLFLGTTRNHNEGREVEELEYEAYAGMAEKELERIAGEAREKWDIVKVAVVHRIGVVPIGEASVMIAVSAAHRGPAFEAARYTIDRLKEVGPIWKKEFFEGGAVWIGDQAGQQGTWENAGDEPGKPARDTGGSGEPA